MAVCHTCGSPIDAQPPIGRSLECPSCNAPVRCCKNCAHYAPGAHWDCRESISDPVHDKERGNFCDWFRLSDAAAPAVTGDDARRTARDSFDSLFS